MSSKCSSNNPFDIRNHKQYAEIIRKLTKDCELRVNQARMIERRLCAEKIKALETKVAEQEKLLKFRGNEQRTLLELRIKGLKNKVKTSAVQINRLINIVKQLRIKNKALTKQLEKFRNGLKPDLKDDPRVQTLIDNMQKKFQVKLAIARAEVELHWKKKMYTNIKNHPEYANLVKKFELEMEELRMKLENKCPDLYKTPEYQRLMAKYSECRDSRCSSKSSKKKACSVNKVLREIDEDLGSSKRSIPANADHGINMFDGIRDDIEKGWNSLKCKVKKDEKKLAKDLRKLKRKMKKEQPRPATQTEKGGILVQNTEAMKRQIARSYLN